MFIPEPVEIVGYDEGLPVLRVTRHGGGGTFTDLYSKRQLYSRGVYRGGGCRGSLAEEQEIVDQLEPVLPGYRLVVAHRITAVISGSLAALQDAIAQVNDERVPVVVGSGLDTLPQPSLWCDEWDALSKDAMWDASLTFSERLGAKLEPDLTRALASINLSSLTHRSSTGTACLILPSEIDFCMVLRLRRMCIHNEGRQATHLPVSLGVPRESIISGMLQLRERLIAGDREAEDLFVAACEDPTPLLEAEESDMLGALLAVSVADRYDRRVARRLRELGGAWTSRGCGRAHIVVKRNDVGNG